MSIALIVLAFGCLIAATLLWQRRKKAAAVGAPTGRMLIAIVALVIGALVLAFLSQAVR